MSPAALARVVGGTRGVGEPGHVRNLHAGEPGDPTVARGLSMMPRPGWVAGWHVGELRAAGGTLRRYALDERAWEVRQARSS
jgi:hypothetical protein